MFFEDMTRRGPKAPEPVIVDGAPGLEAALAALWPEAPLQRRTVHKHRSPGSRPGQALLAHAPKRLHDALTEAWRDRTHADTAAEAKARRKALPRASGG